MITKEEILEQLKNVQDPEVDVDIVTMGLIYNIDIDEKGEKVKVLMTYTTPFCFAGPQITEDVKNTVASCGIELENVEVEVTFEPPWKAPPDLRVAMGV
ncbi:MAG TPA: metal-sulfur cluster assembly factor [Candidatus Magasanikbacteria bacterium]|nr:metal-sulfur cluster assembly factor [Candidatus Magasanikbacteria bacterium]